MRGRRDWSVSPYSLPEITERRIFASCILLRANQAKMFNIVYISIMIKHIRVIFLHFGFKNQNRVSEYEFYTFSTSNALQFFNYFFFTFTAVNSLRFLKDQRVYLHTCSFQPALSGSFLGAEDLFYHIKANISRHVENSLSEHLVTIRPRGLINVHRHEMLTPP